MAIFAVAILVTTGIVDEDYLLLYWVMSSQHEHLQPDKIQKIAEAVSNFDLRALTTIGIPFLRPVLTVYAVKCLVYVMAFAFILAWAPPRIKILYRVRYAGLGVRAA